ncbi:MAG: patatin family protein [Lachnospiraceae bacterium]|nr:patatin family protein [Lachnospiraceae bacterium]
MKVGLVLEGGGTRGIFTSGVLDRMMREGIDFPYVIGVSAGACNGIGFMSKQIGRTRDCMIPTPGDTIISVKNLRKAHSIYDMTSIFDSYPYKEYPLDFETLFANPAEFEVVATNCLTGEATYFSERDPDKKELLMEMCKASCSLPFLASETVIEGVPYMDGGLADSVPVARAQTKGCTRFVIVLTRQKGFRRKANGRIKKRMEKVYRRYPKLIETMDDRYLMYNEEMDLVDWLEEQGRAFVIRPTGHMIDKTESDHHELLAFYSQGYRLMDERMDELKRFLSECGHN